MYFLFVVLFAIEPTTYHNQATDACHLHVHSPRNCGPSTIPEGNLQTIIECEISNFRNVQLAAILQSWIPIVVNKETANNILPYTYTHIYCIQLYYTYMRHTYVCYICMCVQLSEWANKYQIFCRFYARFVFAASLFVDFRIIIFTAFFLFLCVCVWVYIWSLFDSNMYVHMVHKHICVLFGKHFVCR